MKTRYRISFLFDVPDAGHMEQTHVFELIKKAIESELLLWPDYDYRDLSIIPKSRVRTKRKEATQ